MIKDSPPLAKSKTPTVILIMSILVPLFWFLSQVLNVYKAAWLGAVFEIFWLPMLVLLFILPVLSLIFWIRTKFNFRSLYFYSLIISVISILFLVTSK